MKYLMNSHAALWLFEGNTKLPHYVQDILFNVENQIYISIVSAWEVAIKVSLSKLDLDGGVETFLAKISENNINLVGIKNDYVKAVEALPLIHRDPFDRLIIATAISEDFTVISIDENIQKYDVNCVW